MPKKKDYMAMAKAIAKMCKGNQICKDCPFADLSEGFACLFSRDGIPRDWEFIERCPHCGRAGK